MSSRPNSWAARAAAASTCSRLVTSTANRQRPSARRTDSRGGLLGGPDVHVRDRHRRAFGRQFGRRRGADPAACAGQKRHPTIQSSHSAERTTCSACPVSVILTQ